MKKELLKYETNEIDLFYSLDMKIDELTSEIALEIVAEESNDLFYKNRNPKEKEIIDLNAKKNNLEKIAALYTHGDSVNGEWHYINEDQSFPIQEWINQNDGKYKLLVLSACNPGHHEITSEKSCVLATNENYNKRKFEIGDVQIELYVPGIGYIDSYTIDSQIGQLRE